MTEPSAGRRPASARQLSLDGRDISYILFRHKGLAFAFFVAVMAGAAATLWRATDTYVSEAQLLLRRGRENVTLDPTVDSSKVIPLYADWESDVNTSLGILRSRELAEQVVVRIGPETILDLKPEDAARKPPEPRALKDQAVLVLTKRLRIDVEKKSSLVTLSYPATDPDVARSVVAKLIEAYLQKHMAVYQNAGAYDFFQQQTAALRKQLDDAEMALKNFKSLFGIASMEQQQGLHLSRIRALGDQLARVDSDTAAARARTIAIQNMQSSTNPAATSAMMSSQGLKDLQAQLILAETQLAALGAEREEVRKQLGLAEQELKNLTDSDLQLRVLQRDKDTLEAKYRKYLENLEQARIDRELEKENISNVSIVQAATAPALPKPGNRKLKLIFAFCLALGGSLCIAFVAEHLDHTLGRPEDIERFLDLPTLVSIPVLRNAAQPVPGRPGPALAGAVASTEVDRLWNIPSGVAEYFEVLRVRTLRALQPVAPGPIVIGVTSCRSGEGVSFVAANLAVALSRYAGDAQVLYVDANVQHTARSRSFGMKTLGAAEIRTDEAGRTNVVEQTMYGLVTPGQESSSPLPASAMLMRYDKLLPVLRTRNYSYVVVDIAPMSEGSPPLRICGPMDGVVLVVESESVRWEVAQWAKTMLEESNAHVLGVALNKRRYYVPEWLYQRV